MKFVHIADMHFDSPFVNLSDREGFGDTKRLEQRRVFKKIIEYIKENKIPYFFISGDLYEQKYIRKSTIEYINQLFLEIPDTKIFISPGNHDPYIKNSYYYQYKWADNVTIFNSEIDRIEFPEVDIYGFGFNDFYCTDCNIENLELKNPEKLNILVIHSTIDGANIEEKQYNSISKRVLERIGFDYVATGHIHKIDYTTYENPKIVYPGSTVALGFDEIGKHGMIVGDIEKVQNKEIEEKAENAKSEYIDEEIGIEEKKGIEIAHSKEKNEKDSEKVVQTNDDVKIEIQMIPLSEIEFVEKNLDVTDILDKDDLIQKIDEMNFELNEYVKIILIGKRNFEINTYELYKSINQNQVIKIKDRTKINYDLEKISNESTLKGIFAKKMLEKLNNDMISSEEKDIIEKAIEIGFEALE